MTVATTTATETLCRHCQRGHGTYPRGLCCTCYNDPSCRVHYPLDEHACLRRGHDDPCKIAAGRAEVDTQLVAEYRREQADRAARESGKATVPFGPYRGWRLQDLDEGYLRWLLPWAAGTFEGELRRFLGVEREVVLAKDEE